MSPSSVTALIMHSSWCALCNRRPLPSFTEPYNMGENVNIVTKDFVTYAYTTPYEFANAFMYFA
jgi:hypothetical protein